MARLGAAHVIGVDVSEAMLQAARHRLSADDEAGVVWFEAGDLFSGMIRLGEGKEEEEGAEGTFDLVTGSWCLNYPGDRNMMRIAWRNAAHFLKPAGRAVGIMLGKFMEWLEDKEVYYGLFVREG